MTAKNQAKTGFAQNFYTGSVNLCVNVRNPVKIYNSFSEISEMKISVVLDTRRKKITKNNKQKKSFLRCNMEKFVSLYIV